MWRAFSSAMLRVGNRAGASSIEFALVALIFLFLLVAISDIARYLFMVQSMQLLATQAARATIVPFGMITTISAFALSISVSAKQNDVLGDNFRSVLLLAGLFVLPA